MYLYSYRILSPPPGDIHCNVVSITDIDPGGLGKLSAATLHFEESQLTFIQLSTS
jgi:hypothetical protein